MGNDRPAFTLNIFIEKLIRKPKSYVDTVRSYKFYFTFTCRLIKLR